MTSRKDERGAWRRVRSVSTYVVVLLVLGLTRTANAGESRPDVLWSIGGHSADVLDVKHSPDGMWFGSASLDGTLKVWNALDGSLALTVTSDTNTSFPNYGLAFSPDSSTVVAASVGGGCEYDLASGEILRNYCCVESALAVAFSPAGDVVAVTGSATGSEETTLVFAYPSGVELATLEFHNGFLGGTDDVVFSADGALIITAGEEVRYWNLASEQIVLTLDDHDGRVHAVALSPDGTQLLTAGADGLIKLRNIDDGRVIRTFTGHEGAVTGITFSPDGERVASGGHDGTVRVWMVADGDELTSIAAHEGAVANVHWSPDGQVLLSGGGFLTFPFGDNTVRRFDANSGAAIDTLTQVSESLESLDLSADGQTMLAATVLGQVALGNSFSGTLEPAFDTDCCLSAAALSPDASAIAGMNHHGTVMLFDAVTGEIVNGVDAHGFNAGGLDYSNDGQFLASSAFGQEIAVWEADSLQFSHGVNNTNAVVIMFSDDSTLLASSASSTLLISDAVTGNLVTFLTAHFSNVIDLSFSGDSQRIISGSSDTTARVWDIAGETQLQVFDHNAWVAAVALSPDGTIAATASGQNDRALRVWNADDGSQIADYTVDVGPGPVDLRFSPDDRVIYYARADATIVAIRNPAYAPTGDVNLDGMANLADWGSMSSCLAGPDVQEVPAGCAAGVFAASDVHVDLDVDLRDVGLVMSLIGVE